MKEIDKDRLLLTDKKPNLYSACKDTTLESQPSVSNLDSDHFPTEILLTWKDVSVHCNPTIKQSCSWFRKKSIESKKQILFNVNGLAKPGESLAVMGISGVGKTTLLNTLTLKGQNTLKVSGQVLINHQPVTSKTMAAVSAYVRQDDLFIGTLTVREQLIFQATLRISNANGYSQILQRVDEVIFELGLTKCQNTLIGIVGRIKGISGGEKQRLAIACEVLTDPPLMFCDEPTSGLDSSMALNVVKLLQNLAAKGKTVICTIHQPSSQLYSLFDKILFLAEGKVAFFGTKDDALKFFDSLGYACPLNYNPADYFIHTLSVANDDFMEEKKLVISGICNAFDKSKYYVSVKEKIDNKGLEQKLDKISYYKVSWIKQAKVVMWRSCLSCYREPLLMQVRLFNALFLGLLIGFIYYRQSLTQLNVNNINSAMFYLMVSATFPNLFAVINVLASEFTVFLREHWSGLYRTEVYFLSKTLAELPVFIITPIIYISSSYWLIGLYPDIFKFLVACFVYFLVVNCATSLGYLISAVSSSTTMALTIGSPVVLPLLLFGGFFIHKDSIPWYLTWIQYISWFKYGYESLAINQWKDVEYIECNVNNITCPKTGLVVLQTLGFKPSELETNIICLIGLLLAIRLLALVSFSIRALKKD